jgi:L-gulonolactone oxidase
MTERFANWAGQYACAPRRVERVASAEDAQRVVRRARADARGIRVFGSGHSPSDIAMSDDVMVTLERLDRIVSLDRPARRVTVEGGATLAAIDDALLGAGLALPNLGSISAQTIAGAIATATHGTGLEHGTLSTLVEGVTLVSGEGEIVRIAPGSNERWLDGVRCHLGALGIVTEVTLAVSDAFDLAVEERPATLEDTLANLDERTRADHYRFWYLPHVDRTWEWTAARTAPGAERTPGRRERARSWLRERLMGHHALEASLYVASFEDRLVPFVNRAYARAMFSRPRASRGRSRAMFNFDCLFKQHVDEWAIPIDRTGEALRAIRALIAERGFRVHLPIEVRFAKADSIWLSPCHGRDSAYIGVIAYMPYGRSTPHREYFEAFEALMMRLGGRPHWAKRFGPVAATLRERYPRWDAFMALRAELDPSGTFSNGYTDRVLGRAGDGETRTPRPLHTGSGLEAREDAP